MQAQKNHKSKSRYVDVGTPQKGRRTVLVKTSSTVLKRVWQHKIAKNSVKTPINAVQLRSFKVIDVGTPGKLVSSACYDKQQVCVYIMQRTVLMPD